MLTRELHGGAGTVLESSARRAMARTSRLLGRTDWPQLGLFLGLLVSAIAAVSLYKIMQHLAWDDLVGATRNVAWPQLVGAAGASLASYLALAGLDVLALHQIGAGKVPLRYTVLTSFISHSFTFTLGFGALTGGAVRLRRYQRQGLSPESIISAALLASVTFWMGLAAIAGICLATGPHVANIHGIGPVGEIAVGLSILAVLGGWIAYTALRPRALTISGWKLPLPGATASLGALLIGITDTTFAALALWLLLPADIPASFPSFIVIFVAATIFGVISHVPGGLGVFDAILILALPGLSTPEGLGALLLFRLVYYIGPFTLSALAVGAQEAMSQAAAIAVWRQKFSAVTGPFLGLLCAIAVFLGGVVLLLSGATPADHDRMSALRSIVPLPFVETSHFVASLVGAVLLVVGYGLAQRLRSAWNVAAALLAAGAIFSLAKGFDYEEAIVCLAIVALLWLARPEFYRRTGLLDAPLSWEWALAILVTLLASAWVGFAAYQNVSYENSMWWHFAYRGDAPRFLRATLGIVVAGMMFLLYRLLHSTPASPGTNNGLDAERIQPLTVRAANTDAQLALLGDKQFVLTQDRSGFLMYGVQGSTWLAMGDPVGVDDHGAAELIWRFKEMADLHNSAPAFYQITARYITLFIDAGFSLAKLGEDAHVDLSSFTLEGGEGRKWRQSKAHAERKGLSFEIVPATQMPALLPQLKTVSDAWLASRGGREKGFSLGFWSEPYLRRYDHAIVREGARIVAFANIWRAGVGGEYSVDLMRHLPDAPGGVMDYLFICLMEAAKGEGFSWFNLGMAPLSGLPRHRLASRWSRLAALIHRHGDSFYNFEGLRAFKSKFKPVWRPRYLAHPGGLSMARVLMDATTLIAASPKRIQKTGSLPCA